MQTRDGSRGGNNLQALQTRDTTEKIVVWERKPEAEGEVKQAGEKNR